MARDLFIQLELGWRGREAILSLLVIYGLLVLDPFSVANISKWGCFWVVVSLVGAAILHAACEADPLLPLD